MAGEKCISVNIQRDPSGLANNAKSSDSAVLSLKVELFYVV